MEELPIWPGQKLYVLRHETRTEMEEGEDGSVKGTVKDCVVTDLAEVTAVQHIAKRIKGRAEPVWVCEGIMIKITTTGEEWFMTIRQILERAFWTPEEATRAAISLQWKIDEDLAKKLKMQKMW